MESGPVERSRRWHSALSMTQQPDFSQNCLPNPGRSHKRSPSHLQPGSCRRAQVPDPSGAVSTSTLEYWLPAVTVSTPEGTDERPDTEATITALPAAFPTNRALFLSAAGVKVGWPRHRRSGFEATMNPAGGFPTKLLNVSRVIAWAVIALPDAMVWAASRDPVPLAAVSTTTRAAGPAATVNELLVIAGKTGGWPR